MVTNPAGKSPSLLNDSMKTLLFLCTGNYYRSRFAEILFNWHAQQDNLPWRSESRGLALDPMNLGHMSHYTVKRLERMQICVDEYRRDPRDLSISDLSTAQHVIAVKGAEHRPLNKKRFPEWLDKIEFWEVHDIDCADPEEALPHLEREVLQHLQLLRQEKRPG